MTSWLIQVDRTVPSVAVRGCGWGQTLPALCLQFAGEPLLAALKAGYEVFAVIDSSGTWSKLVQEVSIARIVQAGVVPMTWAAMGAELQADWRNSTGEGLCQIMGEHLSFYGNLFGSYLATKD